MFRVYTKQARIACGAALLTAILACASLAPAQQSKKPAKPRSKAPAPAAAAPATAPVPFRVGEILEYRVLFSKYAVNAAKIETSVIEQRNFFGRPAWHFRATAHTIDTTRLLYAIDDQFDSYSSVSNLTSLQYEMYLHEQGKEQTSVYRMTTDADPAPAQGTALRVVPGTCNAIDFLYSLRAADWQRTPERRTTVFEGQHLYDTVARIDTPQGMVHVPAGDLLAFRVAIRLSEHGKEITDTRIWLWFTKDAAHIPALIEAEIPIGTFRVELMRLP
jgi:hypothetical protein